MPTYVRLVLALVVSWVALCHAAHASRPEELPLPAWTGAVTTAGDVTTIDGRSAAITFGGAGVADYAGELEVKLVVLRGNPASFVLFPGDDGKSGFVRLDLARGAGGASLGARRSDWDAAAGKWVVDRQQAVALNYLPPPRNKALAELAARDGMNPTPYTRRWVRLRLETRPTHVDLWAEGLMLYRIPLPKGALGPVRLTLGKGDQVRSLRVEPLSAAVPYLPVDISRLAAGTHPPASAEAVVTHDGVPFRWLDEGKTRLDLSQARWPEAAADPSRYNESYDDGPAILFDPRQPQVRVPSEDYVAAHLLAVADDDPRRVPVLTLRAGRFDTRRQTLMYDFTGRVPTASQVAQAPAADVVDSAAGRLVHVTVPMGAAFAQDVAGAIEIELTKEVRLARRRPDPSRFRYRPLGLPSGVRIAAITLERSPLQMTVTSAQSGHAFVQPEAPEFTVELRNITDRKLAYELHAVSMHQGGTKSEARQSGAVEAGKMTQAKLRLPTDKRGYHDVGITLLVDGRPLLARTTSFAILPPDTRQHRGRSPFGTWDFSGKHFTSNDAGAVGPLYKKAGLRYGMFRFTAEERARWGVVQGNEPEAEPDLKKYTAWRERSPDGLKTALLMHENSISGPHATRGPDLFHDRAPYELTEADRQRFAELRANVEAGARAVRALDPTVELRLGNGPLPTKEEFLRAKFPAELFDTLGNESGTFGRPPESQPPDWVANNASLWMDRQLLEAYGYGDKRVVQCYEICYPSTNPGNLTPREQADYLVRHAMHSLAWGVPEVRFGIISDVGNSYRFSNWGAAGLTRPTPELNAKPAFVSVATMTRVLDGASFSRKVDLGSLSLYGVEFNSPGGRKTYVLWTLRGERHVDLDVSGGGDGWTLIDSQAEERPLTAGNGKPRVTLSPSPVYLVGNAEVKGAGAGAPRYTDEPRGKIAELAAMDSRTGWSVQSEPHYAMEYYNPLTPRRKGDFQIEDAADGGGDGKPAIKVTPKPLPAAKPTLAMPMYAVLRPAEAIDVPGRPTEIGVWVNGNSGWGRIVFELQDAKGQTWTSIGAPDGGEPSPWMLDWMPKEALRPGERPTQADWNTDDVFGRSRINFDGWRYVGFPLPGHYPGEGHVWPASSQWRYAGDGTVHYPLKVTGVIVELNEKVLHLTDWVPVPKPEIYLRRLVVAQDDAPTVKRTVGEWTP